MKEWILERLARWAVNWQIKALALVLALLLWFYLRHHLPIRFGDFR